MYYNSAPKDNYKRNAVSTWYGYNHNPIINEGELYFTKNMSTEHYPILAPRQKRTMPITVGESEWGEVETELAAEFHGDIAKPYAIISTEVMAEGETRYKLTFDIADNIDITKADLVVTFYDLEEKTSEKTKIISQSTDIIIITPARCSRIRIDLTISPKKDAEFKEEKLFEYVTNYELWKAVDNVRGIIIKDSTFCYLQETTLHIGEDSYDLEEYMAELDHTSRQKLVSYGAYILIFPLGVYFNTVNPEDRGSLSAYTNFNTKVTYKLSTQEGTTINAIVSETAPTEHSDGDYWLCTREGSKGLYQWIDSMSMYRGVATTYISIQIAGAAELNKVFSVDDAVFMNTPIEDINNGSIIRAIGEDFIVVTGLITDTIEADGIEIERSVPQLDFVCVSQNRVWGCYQGRGLNEIYACKLGDPKNWYSYEGIASDSYAVSISDDGEFTGAITYQGNPYFFKENSVYTIYGNYPAAYQLYTYNCRGCQKGSENSLAVVGNYLIYKSNKDVCVFDGNSPSKISDALGNYRYSKASAGAAVGKYYISMYNEDLKAYELFTYDIDKGLWMREDNLKIDEFASISSGKLLGNNGLRVYGFEETDLGEKEEYVEFEAITGAFGYEYIDAKYINRLTFRAYIPFDSDLEIAITYNDRDYEIIDTLRGNAEVELQTLTFTPTRCDHYRVRFRGHGDVRIYSLAKTYGAGSEEEQ